MALNFKFTHIDVVAKQMYEERNGKIAEGGSWAVPL